MSSEKQEQRTSVVDMHCHILPGVDDGPETMEETMAVLREAQRQGIGAMIVTPHFHPGRYMVTAGRVMEVLRRVRLRMAEEGLNIRLIPGQECYYFSGLIDELEAGNVLTMAGTRIVLVEFETETQFSTISHAVRELCDSGYRPIVAHFERYRCLYQRKDRLEGLRNSGALLQLNFDRLVDRGNILHPNGWRKLLKEGYVDFLGSDTHGMKLRPLHVGQAVEWLNKGVQPELRKRILNDNIRMLQTRGSDKGSLKA